MCFEGLIIIKFVTEFAWSVWVSCGWHWQTAPFEKVCMRPQCSCQNRTTYDSYPTFDTTQNEGFWYESANHITGG